MMFDTPESRLVLAVDVARRADAERQIDATRGVVGVYKIGLEFAMSGGLEMARDLASDGIPVFLDMKLLDIANTVAGATKAAAALGVRFLTVHAYPQALSAAVAAAPHSLTIVAVTVLTSFDDEDVRQAGYEKRLGELASHRIAQAAEFGAGAIVCAPQEAAAAKRSGLRVITPGVRMEEDAAGDQKRVATPERAIAAGADALVVGRPITGASDVRGAAERYRDAIGRALPQVRH